MSIRVRGTWGAFLAFVGFGAVCILLYSFTASTFSAGVVSAVLLLLSSGAALAVFGVLGFLFGIPRLSDKADAAPILYIPNTALEQISDWLTKILIGATIAQAARVRDWFSSFATSVGHAVSTTNGSVMVGLLAAYFACAGFVGGWLATRMYLNRLMKESDQAVRELQAIASAQKDNNPALASAIEKVLPSSSASG